jgi:WD40 repeat protein
MSHFCFRPEQVLHAGASRLADGDGFPTRGCGSRMGKRSLHYRLNARETGAATWPEQNPVLSSARQPLDLLRHASGHAALVRRLTQTSVLSGHEATVTAVSWNEPGTHLISSSDDCRVKIWDVQRSRMLRTIETVRAVPPSICDALPNHMSCDGSHTWMHGRVCQFK